MKATTQALEAPLEGERGMTVDEYRASLDPERLEAVDLLRALVAQSNPDLDEHIKWNAPSFQLDGEDRITLGLERKGGLRVVVHRGAKNKDVDGFAFSDPDGLARWPAPGRGVISFRDSSEIERRSEALVDLCTRWLAMTR